MTDVNENNQEPEENSTNPTQPFIDYKQIAKELFALQNAEKSKENNTSNNLTSIEFQKKEIEDKARLASEKEKIANMTRYVSTFDQFISENSELLPEQSSGIRAYYDKNNSDDEARYFGYRADILTHFFENDKENMDLLVDSEKDNVKRFLNRASDDRDESKLNDAYKSFQNALNIKNKLMKQKQVLNANNVNSSNPSKGNESLLEMQMRIVKSKDMHERQEKTNALKNYFNNIKEQRI